MIFLHGSNSAGVELQPFINAGGAMSFNAAGVHRALAYADLTARVGQLRSYLDSTAYADLPILVSESGLNYNTDIIEREAASGQAAPETLRRETAC